MKAVLLLVLLAALQHQVAPAAGANNVARCDAHQSCTNRPPAGSVPAGTGGGR